MILGFSQKFPKGKNLKGRPTNFKAKTLSGTKIHSMRENKSKRWKIGMIIQFCYGVRTPQFHEWNAGPLISMQAVKIVYTSGRAMPEIYIDERRLGIMEITMLAMNDGFDSLADFLEWFDESCEVDLLHWTDFTYDGNKERLDKVNAKFKSIQN